MHASTSQFQHVARRSQPPGCRKLPRLSLALLAAGLAQHAQALDYVWLGGAGNWDDPVRWSLPGVPGAVDSATVNTGSVALSADRAVQSFRIGGGQLLGAGHVVANSGLLISGNSNRTLGSNSGTVSSGIVNNGAGTWSGSGSFDNWSSGRFTNGSTGSLDIQTDADFFAGTFINQGSLIKSVGAGGAARTDITARFDNTGSVNVQQGILRVAGGGTHSGSFTSGVNSWTEFAGSNSTPVHELLAGSSVTGNARHVNSFGATRVNVGAIYNTTRTEITSGGFLEVANGASASTATMGIFGGTYRGAGNLSASGVTEYTAGTVGGFGGNIVANGGLAISGTSQRTLGSNSGTVSSGIVNNGAGTWSGSGNFDNWSSGRFTNGSTGSLDIQTDADFFAGTFINQGSLIKSVGAGGAARTDITARFDNTGSVNVQQGILRVAGGGTHSGSFTSGVNSWTEFAGSNSTPVHELLAGSSVTGNARHVNSFGATRVNVGAIYNTTRTEITSGGFLEVANGASASTATMGIFGGTYRGAGNLSASGVTEYTAGTVGGFGGNIVANGGLAISGTSQRTLGSNSGTVSSGIVNNGAGTWSGSGNFDNWSSGRFTNGSTGSLDIQTDADFFAGTFINQGSLIKSVGAGGAARTDITARFDNTGSVNVQQGILRVAGGGTHSGSFTSGVNSWTEFAGSNSTPVHELLAGSSVTGNARHVNSFGATRVNVGAIYNTTRTEITSGGFLEVANGASASTATMGIFGGTYRGAGNLSASGVTEYTAGTVGGFGGNIVANGGLAISGTSQRTLGSNSGTVSSGIVNNGAGTWSGSGNFDNWSSGRFTNGSTGSLDIQTDADFFAGTFINQGSLIKSVGAGGTARTDITAHVQNTGLIAVEQGTVRITTAFDNQGSVTTAAGAVFHADNAAFSNAGTISGNGTVRTQLDNDLVNTGVVAPGFSIGTLTLDGDLTLAGASVLAFELTTPALHDVLTITDDVSFAGALAVSSLGYVPQVGDSFRIITFDQRLADSTFSSITWTGFDPGVTLVATYNLNDVTLTVTAVPEPGTWAMWLAGLASVAGLMHRRRQCAGLRMAGVLA